MADIVAGDFQTSKHLGVALAAVVLDSVPYRSRRDRLVGRRLAGRDGGQALGPLRWPVEQLSPGHDLVDQTRRCASSGR